MVIHERVNYNIIIMPKGWQELMDEDFCPVCEKKNPRRYRCCSPDCTTKFWEKAFGSWELRYKCFKRDNHTCVKCSVSNVLFFEWINRKFKWLKINPREMNTSFSDEVRYVKATFDHKIMEIPLEADHIVPIALGGAQFELENYQTLCEECHKKKTAKDMKKIALARKNQTTLEEI